MSTTDLSAAPTEPGLPLVVQLSFAGSRQLFDPTAQPGLDAAAFHDAVQRHLTERLRQLPAELGLGDRYFFCGLSQLAVGADTLFTRACRDLSWPQRFFLPQPREEFLSAVSSRGTPDFTDPQRDEARQLFASPHVIHERVASDSPDRHTRFQEVNLELVRVSDLVVCLMEAVAAGKAGGTRELVEEANQRQRPLLEIRVQVGPKGQPVLTEEWHHRALFAAPRLPAELRGLRTKLTGIPAVADYCQPLKKFASRESRVKQTLFKITALIIIGTHLLATACAVIALKLHGSGVLPWLLGGELLLLALGFGTHQYLHRTHAPRVWAMARLVAEIARSALALRQVPGYLGHLFTLPLPESLRGLLATLNVLHLRETRPLAATTWQARRQNYISTRLDDPESGQIDYYGDKLTKAARWLAVAGRAFVAGSICAFGATLGKLLLVCDCLPVHGAPQDTGVAVLGVLALVLPVIAVAALSLAASFDLEARVHTYREMLAFLRSQKAHLNHAATERAFSRLALETEARLLGETASWYSRRAFTGVT
jgi:hypothetical protein